MTSSIIPSTHLAAIENGFLIIGCQRSGTTLVRLILDSHSHIQCYDEMLSYAMLRRERICDTTRPLAGFKVPMLTEQLDELTYWDRDTASAQPVYSGQKLIGVVRDARDTIASMFGLAFDEDTWFDRFGMRTLTGLICENPAFRERYATALDEVRQAAAADKKIALAALYWRFKVDAIHDYAAAAFPVFVTTYEDIVTNPAPELRRMCEFLEVEWEDRLLRHAEIPHGELMPDGLAIGDTDPRRPIHASSMHQWRRMFTDAQSDLIVRIAGAHHSHYPSTITAAIR